VVQIVTVIVVHKNLKKKDSLPLFGLVQSIQARHFYTRKDVLFKEQVTKRIFFQSTISFEDTRTIEDTRTPEDTRTLYIRTPMFFVSFKTLVDRTKSRIIVHAKKCTYVIINDC
jgi:hypothetical protein